MWNAFNATYESFNGTLKYYLSHNSQTPVFILVKVINKLTDLSYLSLRTFTKVEQNFLNEINLLKIVN